MIRLTPGVLLVMMAAGCSSRSTSPDRGGPIWPDLRFDRPPADSRGPELALPDAAALDRAASDGQSEALKPAPWALVKTLATEDLHAVACSQGHVFAVGAKGTILHRDPAAAGAGFVLASTSITADLHTVTFSVDGSYGATAGKDPQIWQTTDLGKVWSIAPQCSAFVFDTFHALHLSSAGEGFGAGIAVQNGGGGYKYYGGASWVCGPQAYPGEVFHDVYRLGPLGTIVGDTGGKIYHTEDSGLTWTTVPAGTLQVLRGVAFAGGLLGVAVGAGGTILRSLDGKGLTWSGVNGGVAEDLEAVHLWDTLHGWAVGGGGTILFTKDGGQSWNPQPSGTKQRLEGVCFSSASEGWVVGAGGVVLHTTSGGQ
jgi:photosystem II stability/assembly factor-like uncharacterized protein